MAHYVTRYIYIVLYINIYIYIYIYIYVFVTQSCPTLCTPWTAACQASLSFIISQSVLKLMPIELVMPYSHLILCHPLLLLPSILPSIRVFFSESALCIFSLTISPSNEYSGLSSFVTGLISLIAKGL